MCNHKQFGRLQAGSHSLATLNGAFDHNAIDWRGDAGAGQIDAGLRQRRLPLRHIGLRAPDLRLGHAGLGLRLLEQLARGVDQRTGTVRLTLRDELLFNQNLFALQVSLCLLQVHLRPRHAGPTGRGGRLRCDHGGIGGVHVGLGRAHPVLKGFGVNAGDQLAGLHFGIEIHIQVLDLARDLGAHRHLFNWVDRATCRHRGLQAAAFNFGGAVLHRLGGVALDPPPVATTSGQGQAN